MTYQTAVFTDLDGTLLNGDSQLSELNLGTLKRLGEMGILRVAATGRSLFSVRKIFGTDAPFDYLISSTGCGIYHWPSQKLIKSCHLTQDELALILPQVQAKQLDFMLQDPLPENHCFAYEKYSEPNPGFHARLELFSDYARPWNAESHQPKEASELLIIIPVEKTADIYAYLLELCSPLNVIPLGSPLESESSWIEILSAGASKSQAAQYLLELEDIEPESIMAIGNDYNDIDLLDWAPHSYIVENAADDLKKGHHLVATHNEDGFTQAVAHWLKAINY